MRTLTASRTPVPPTRAHSATTASAGCVCGPRMYLCMHDTTLIVGPAVSQLYEPGHQHWPGPRTFIVSVNVNVNYLYQDGVVLRSGCRQGSKYNQAAVVAAPVRHLPSALTSRGGKGGVRADRHPLPLTLSARPPAALRGSDAAMRTCGQMRRL